MNKVKMLECIKMLMGVKGVPASRLCKWRRSSPQTINALLNGKDIKCGAAVDVLEFLGYEVIVREKRPRYRDADEIIINYDKGDLDVEQLFALREEQRRQEAKKKKYAELEADLKKEFPGGMRKIDLKNYFGRNTTWTDKWFNGMFFGGLISVDDVIGIMRDNNL